ncbi:unnamed protein product [Miscanthus lutarioriparius]|uniref:DNA helicase n=1 Tax=Miscanthus lutarioriparius TaxID=422564 RepID=A0A811Q1A3_9POAL|nr:unnamed protein product [Miscanthus lutarioriparius]
MRFRNALGSRLFQWCSHEYHTSVRKLLDVDGASERSKLLKKMSVLMGYSYPQDLVGQQIAPGESTAELISAFKEIDFPEIAAKFPCIKIGDASPVELYEDSTNMKFKETVLSENLTNFIRGSGRNLETAYEFHNDCHPLSQTPTTADDLLISEDIPLMTQHISQEPAVDKKSCPKSMSDAITSDNSILDKSIRCLPGTTSRQCRQLEDAGFHTVRKLLQHFPRTYADLQNPQGPIEDGQYIMLFGTVISSRGIKVKSTLGFLEVVVGCSIVESELSSSVEGSHSGAEQKRIHLHLKKFFSGTRFSSQHFLNCMSAKHKEGDLVFVSGKIKKALANGHYELKEHTIDALEGEGEQSTMLDRKPHPIYPSKAGLKPSLLGLSISRALKILNPDVDPMPPDVLVEFNLLNLFDISTYPVCLQLKGFTAAVAYMGIHKPKDRSEADLARRRLIFDDFFYLQLGRLFQMLEAVGMRVEKEELLYKCKNHELNTVGVDDWSPLTKKLLRALPYSLTQSQMNAVKEIIWDLRRPVPMNRLLQGDVGCGKTIVAFLACMEVVNSGFQAAFMVPTEVLAVQHYEHLTSLLEKFDGDEKPNIAMLTGSTSTRESRIIRNGLETGEIAMVIGTHSLIADKTDFSSLRISVIDEQQRFGVVQRGRFNSKLYTSSSKLSDENTSSDETSDSETFMAPHVLAIMRCQLPMFLLYMITDLPPGRQPIETLALEGNDVGFQTVFQMMRDELIDGGKVYLVYPIIDESDQLPQLRAATAEFDSIKKKIEGYPCGLLHGRMRSNQKEETLSSFRGGETRILLSTQVIEIGVDVPDASMMIVMNAERLEIDGGILQEAHLAALKVLVASNDLALYPRLKVELSMRQPLCILGD